MTRFTLQLRRWYAMLLLGDEFNPPGMHMGSPSPIHIEEVTSLKTGQSLFELSFFHANYPEGVQGKTYTLKTIHRGQSGLLAQSIHHDPPRFLYVTELTLQWLRHNFPNTEFIGNDPQECMKRLFRAI